MLKRLLKSALGRIGYQIQPLSRPARYAHFEEPEVRDYEALKEFAARAARFCTSAEQVKVVRNFCLAGFRKDQPEDAVTQIEIGDDRTRSVGIWRREAEGDQAAFVRDPNKKDEWLYWASEPRIEPKRTRWRVALLGESVARGYFYDPQFNVATVLRVMLEAQLGSQAIDVIDLAKSNLRIPDLRACIGQSLALSPDVLVIFAGNNWHPHLSDSDIPSVESLLREQGVPGMKDYLDHKRREAARNLTIQANQLLSACKVKVVWVIPETNLEDWKDPQSEAPLLAKGGNTRWRELHRQLREASSSGNASEVRALAGEMHALDRGTSAVPLRYLAEDARSRGDFASERRFLELCRDAVGWDPTFSYPPRVFSPIQESLREVSTAPGRAVVDLPGVFSRHLDRELPGRRLFLDYCHMAAEGIDIAAAEIASKVLTLVAGQQVSSHELRGKAHPPVAKVVGKAAFLAAAHNAAYFQNLEIVKYWCDTALASWPECAPLMARFADYATRDLPIVMCKSGLELSEPDEFDLARQLLHGRSRRLDLTFGDAAVASLYEVGIDMRDAIARLRTREHSPSRGPKELTNFFYSAAIPARFDHGWTSCAFPTNHGSHSIYASAFWETSNYIFFAEKGRGIEINFIFRVRSASRSDATVILEVNGRRAAALTAGGTWSTRTISVPQDLIVEGLNEIAISWPTDEAPSDALLAESADTLLATRLPCFFRVFGEIHSLSIAIAPG